MLDSVLLTGATGFLGSKLLENFIVQNYNVVIIKRKKSNLYRIKHLQGKYHSVDIDDINLDTLFQQYSIKTVVHTACNYGRNGENSLDILKANMTFGIEILEFSIKWKVKTFINTDTALPSNLSIYSKSKSYFRDWLEYHATKIQIVNIRLEHLYGPNDDSNKFVPWLIDQMLNSTDPIRLTSGIQKRDFVFISDVVNAYNVILSSNLKESWNMFDITTNNFVELKKIIELLVDKMELKFNLKIRHRLVFDALPYRKGELMIPDMNNRSLLDLGWRSKVAIDEGFDIILNNYL